MLVHCALMVYTLMEGKGEGKGHPSKTRETVCLSCLLVQVVDPFELYSFKWILDRSFGTIWYSGRSLTDFEKYILQY